MRLAFFCSSLERGRDGVGDYSRRLAGELIRQGHPSIVCALNDHHVSQAIREQQTVEGTEVSVLRLSATLPWDQRVAPARDWLAEFDPDLVSFQFVPFGFHPKGLCFGLGKQLVAINTKASWHVMFHELWLGLGRNASTKERAWGALQRLIILGFIRRLRPQVVHTQAEPYRIVLGQEGIPANILPLFGNIPLAEGNGWDSLLSPLVTKSFGKVLDRDKVYLAGVFGAVHPEWDIDHALITLLPLVRRSEKQLGLVFLGMNNLTAETLDKIKGRLQDRAAVVVAGERPASEISLILQTLDIGLATSPWQVLQKSGSVAAMLEHGLPVLVTRDDWYLRGPNSKPAQSSSQLFSPARFGSLATLPARDLQSASQNSVGQVAHQFLESLGRPSQ